MPRGIKGSERSRQLQRKVRRDPIMNREIAQNFTRLRDCSARMIYLGRSSDMDKVRAARLRVSIMRSW